MKKTVLLTLLVVATLAVSAQEKNTSQSYIEKFKDNAIAIMNQSGIPASIVLGIAMHESGNGNSAIAKNLNNQFGMKGSGTSVYYKNKKKVKSSYKAYDSILDSFADFARVLQEKKKFAHLFTGDLTNTDYTGWVKGIQRSGYASDKSWGRQVLALINKYNLNAFDSKKDSAVTVQAQVAQISNKKHFKFFEKAPMGPFVVHTITAQVLRGSCKLQIFFRSKLRCAKLRPVGRQS